jgi:hypothetical protein
MPIVTVAPVINDTDEILRTFTDSVGTSPVTYTYLVKQEKITVTNKGTSHLILTVGVMMYTIPPNRSQTVVTPFTEFIIYSTNGTQSFEAISDEVEYNTDSTQQEQEIFTKIKDHSNQIVNLSGMQVNVKGYGAKGDGVTNDTDAIQNAIADAKVKKLPVYFPTGTYLANITISAWDGMVVYGAGAINTVIKSATTGSDVVTITNAGGYIRSIAIRDLAIDGNNKTSRYGLKFYGSNVYNVSEISNVDVENCGNSGILLQGLFDHITLLSVRSKANGNHGLEIYTPVSSDLIAGLTVINSSFGNNTNAGTYIPGRVIGFNAIGSEWGYNAIGFKADTTIGQSVNLSLVGSRFEGNTQYQAYLSGQYLRNVHFNNVEMLDLATPKLTDQIYIDGVTDIPVVMDHVIGRNMSATGVMVHEVNSSRVIYRGCRVDIAGASVRMDTNGTKGNGLDIGTEGIQIGITATNPKQYDLFVGRNDSFNAPLVRFQQTGPGTSGASVLAVVADGTTTSQYAAYFRSKGTGDIIKCDGKSGTVLEVTADSKVGFFGGTPYPKQTITGSRGGNEALASLITSLAAFGLITDNTTS